MAAQAQTGQRDTLLATIKSRGVLICGVTAGLAGFAIPVAQGRWTGLDGDYCRAIAAAIFDDPDKVKFVPLQSKDRFVMSPSSRSMS